MSVTYYVAFPFFGPRTVPRRAKHRSVKAKATAIKRAEGTSRDPMQGLSHSSVQAIRTLASFRTQSY
jgi:hypothetical protein